MPSSKGVSAGPMMTAFLLRVSDRLEGWQQFVYQGLIDGVPGHDIILDGRS